MAIFQHLAALALRPVFEAAGQGARVSAAANMPETAAAYLRERFSDTGQKIHDALRRAAARAWLALEIALSGETLLNRLDRNEDGALREQLRRFLDALPRDSLPSMDRGFRAETLRELRAARAGALLSDAAFDPADLAPAAAPLGRPEDPGARIQAEWKILNLLADEILAAHYHNLARMLASRPADGRSLLAVFVRCFFRLEVERDAELSPALAFAPRERPRQVVESALIALADKPERWEQLLDDLHVNASETRAHGLDIRGELSRQDKQLQTLGSAILQILQSRQLDARTLNAGDSLSIGGEVELRQARDLAGRYRALPEPQRKQLPALLYAVGKLEMIAGDFAGAYDHFHELAAFALDSSGRAEAQYSRFRAALEQQHGSEALDALVQAASLDRKRFAPFPLSKFEPERILGAGGFGVAILCRNRHSGARVVVKSLRTDVLDRPVSEMFREARLLEELDNPAIIRIRDCDFADAEQTRPFIVMDYFDGPTLADQVREHGPLSLEDFLPIALSIGDGLNAAHARGILHRDVKPANILLRRESDRALALGAGSPWQVKLIDFGLALRQNVIRSGLASAPSQNAGNLGASIASTIDYAAPERLGKLANVTVGPAADIYAFGKTCCHALFQTTQPLRKHWRSLPDRFADLLEHCLAENPSDRPMSFAEVLDELGSVARSPHSEPVQLSTGSDGHRKFWSETPAAPASAERTLHGHVGAVLCLDISADGSRILSGGEDHTVRLWDLASGREIRCLPGHRNAVCSLAFTPDGSRAVSSSTDQTVRVWELEAGVTIHSYDRQTNRSVAISADGRLALTGSLHDGMVRLWELGTGKEIRRLRGHTDWVHCVAFSWDGRRILSGGMDRTIRVWDALIGRQLKCMPLQTGRIIDLAISRSGEQAVSCGDDRLVRFWDLKAGRELARLSGHTDSVLSVAISPDGRAAVSAGQDRTVRLWDLVAGREMRRYDGHQGPVFAVRFTPDGRRVVSGGSEGTIRVWRTILA